MHAVNGTASGLPDYRRISSPAISAGQGRVPAEISSSANGTLLVEGSLFRFDDQPVFLRPASLKGYAGLSETTASGMVNLHP